jgi:predicted membrane protein
MDTRMLELIVLALTSALLCGVAIAANHVAATGLFAGLAAAIGVLAVVIRKSQ